MAEYPDHCGYKHKSYEMLTYYMEKNSGIRSFCHMLGYSGLMGFFTGGLLKIFNILRCIISASGWDVTVFAELI